MQKLRISDRRKLAFAVWIEISANNSQFACQNVNWNASGRALGALLLWFVYVEDSRVWNKQITNRDISISERQPVIMCL